LPIDSGSTASLKTTLLKERKTKNKEKMMNVETNEGLVTPTPQAVNLEKLLSSVDEDGEFVQFDDLFTDEEKENKDEASPVLN
jgi:hypothetical protein